MDDHERSFTPSQWTVRMPPSQVVDAFVERNTKDSQTARKELKSELGVRYETKEANTIDFFGGEDLPKDSPILVFFSGGYWQALSGEISSFPAIPLVKRGIRVAIPDYSRAPGVSISEIVREAVSAVRCVLEYGKRNGSRSIHLSGHSAGSHLCAMVLSSTWFSSLPQEDKSLFGGVFHLCGVFHLTPLLLTSIAEPLKMTATEAEANSPSEINNLILAAQNMKGMRVKLYYGEHDAPALIEQGKEYLKSLRNRGLSSASLTVCPGFDHFDLVEELSSENHFLTREIADAVLKAGP